MLEVADNSDQPPSDLRAFAELVRDAHAYDWIVFTSPNGRQAFVDLFYKLYDDAREIGAARNRAIGTGTAQRLKDFHMQSICTRRSLSPKSCARVPKRRERGEFANFLARAEQARDVLQKSSPAWGNVDEGFAYRTVAETARRYGARRKLLERSGLDHI